METMQVGGSVALQRAFVLPDTLGSGTPVDRKIRKSRDRTNVGAGVDTAELFVKEKGRGLINGV